MEISHKFIIAKFSIRKPGTLELIIYHLLSALMKIQNNNAKINLRVVSINQSLYFITVMQNYKEHVVNINWRYFEVVF